MRRQAWLQYADFGLLLRRDKTGYQVDVIDPHEPEGDAEASHCSPEDAWLDICALVEPWYRDFESVLVLSLIQGLEGLKKLLPRSLSTALGRLEKALTKKGLQGPKALGQNLREFLFPRGSKAWDRFQNALRGAEEQGKRLRLRLLIEAQELMSLPWEYLYVDEFESLPSLSETRRGKVDWWFHRASGFLAADGSISIIRQHTMHRHSILPRAKKPHMLVILSSPKRDPIWPPLNAGEEFQRLQVALQDMIDREKIRLETLGLEGKAAGSTLRKMLQEGNFHIIHYIGHAFYNSRRSPLIKSLKPGAYLILEGKNGAAEYLRVEELAEWLRGKATRLVVFNACETGRQEVDTRPRQQRNGNSKSFHSAAQTLVQQADVSVVVALQFQMPVDSAPYFAEAFYRSVVAGMPVDTCVGEARELLMGLLGLFRPDWGIPLVITSSSDLYAFAPGDEVLDAIAPQLTELPGSIGTNTFGDQVTWALQPIESKGEARKCLSLRFHFDRSEAFAGWMIQLEGQRFNASSYARVRFKIAGAQGKEQVELKFHDGEKEKWITQVIDVRWPNWKDVIVPLRSLALDWSHLRVITVAANAQLLPQVPGEETIYIGELRFE